jgi:diguanylate cyclase (GGDEF)-like protein/PAS domain S-box-containing protein
MTQTKPDAKTIRPELLTWTTRVFDFVHTTGPRNLRTALGLLVLGLIITIFAALYTKVNMEAVAQREFDFICEEIQIHIVNRLAASAQLLHGSAGLFDASEIVTREEWRLFTDHLQLESQLPGIQGVGFALLIPPQKLDQHIQEIRSEGFPDYTVWPAGERDVYSSIIFLEPFSGRNQRAFGYDMFSEPVRRAAMEQARDENIAVLSGKVLLVQETSQEVQAGTLMYLPVYRHGLPIDTVEQRRTAILGWVYSPYRMTDMLNGALDVSDMRQKERQISVQVYDGDLISTETLLYDSQGNADKASVSTAMISKITPVDFGGRHWTLRFLQPGGLASTADYSSVWLVLFSGTSISFLLFGLTISLLRTRVNARQMADQLTTELRESEEKYSIVFNNEIYAICIFDLETLKLLEVNKAYERLYGYSREELLSGMDIHDITAEHQDSDAATVQATREGTTFIPLRYHRRKDGTIFPIEIVGGPYVWRGRKVMFALAHDITKRKQAEDALRKAHWRTESVIEGTQVGTWEWNIQTGETDFNEKWAQIIGYTLAELAPISIKTWEKFAHPDDLKQSDELLGRHFAGELPNYEYESRMKHKDGHWVWVLDRGRVITRSSDGKPLKMFGTHQDISDRKRVEMLVQEQSYFPMLNPGPTLRVDAAGFVKLSNPAAVSLGLIVGSSLTELLSLDLVDCIRNGETQIFEAHLKDRIFQLTLRGVPAMNQAFVYGSDITDRKQAEETLRQNEEKYRTVADFAYDWEAWRTADNTYLYVSPSCERISGHTAAEFLADPNLIVQITHPDDRSMVIAHYQTTANESKREDLEFDFRILTPDGETRWIAHSCTIVYGIDGKWLGRRESNREITEKKREEVLLAVSESRYRRLFEAAQDGILILDAGSGMIKDVNPFLIDLLGYSREQFIKKKIWEIGFFKDLTANEDKFIELQQKLYVRYENLPLKTADGRMIYVEFVSNVYLVDNRKVIQCNIRDVSVRKAAEEKVQKLNIELEQLAGTDALTGINNHRTLLQHAEREFDVAMRYQPPLSMMFFDIDNFKQINDVFGHPVGDRALKKMIEVVCAELRSADVIGRYGGDEFVILLPQTSAQAALPLAERIHASLDAMRLDTERGPLTLTISIGIAQTIHETSQTDTSENLLLRADQALYAAKQAGKNCTVIFSSDAAGAI